jgi:lipid-A-disaccharide synthase
MRCPTVLVYRMHPFTAWVFRKLVTGTRHAGLANILAERCGLSREAVMPELLQEAFTPERAAAAVRPYLTDPAVRTRTLAAYDAVNRTLGPGRAAEHAAAVIDDILQHA